MKKEDEWLSEDTIAEEILYFSSMVFMEVEIVSSRSTGRKWQQHTLQ